jgi:hypothetical protein
VNYHTLKAKVLQAIRPVAYLLLEENSAKDCWFETLFRHVQAEFTQPDSCRFALPE